MSKIDCGGREAGSTAFAKTRAGKPDSCILGSFSVTKSERMRSVQQLIPCFFQKDTGTETRNRIAYTGEALFQFCNGAAESNNLPRLRPNGPCL